MWRPCGFAGMFLPRLRLDYILGHKSQHTLSGWLLWGIFPYCTVALKLLSSILLDGWIAPPLISSVGVFPLQDYDISVHRSSKSWFFFQEIMFYLTITFQKRQRNVSLEMMLKLIVKRELRPFSEFILVIPVGPTIIVKNEQLYIQYNTAHLGIRKKTKLHFSGSWLCSCS